MRQNTRKEEEQNKQIPTKNTPIINKRLVKQEK